MSKNPQKTNTLEKAHQPSSVLSNNAIPLVNSHIHTPWSFSAFQNLEQAFELAAKEGIKVLGINDFNTFEGYADFDELSRKYHIYPLFNVEFMGLLEQAQQKGIRINDPANPGRIYFTGKGMDYPVKLSGQSMKYFQNTFDESNQQTRTMLEKASAHLQSIDNELSLSYEKVINELTKGMLRERHIAKAIRLAIAEKYPLESEQKHFFEKIFGGKSPKSSLNDAVQLDNEIRSNLLKAGGPAYVKEDPAAFLPLETILRIIKDGGGIACYPVLLDDKQDNYTEFEQQPELLARELESRGIFSIELIAGRNDFDILRKFVDFFHQRGFLITFGTEHNTPELAPLTVDTRSGKPLDNFLKMINFEGACLIATHQHLRAKGERGLTINEWLDPEKRKKHIERGARLITDY